VAGRAGAATAGATSATPTVHLMRMRLERWARRPGLVVATVGLIAGIGFAFLTPPLAGYDEPYHFLRAYQVSEGRLIASHDGKRFGGTVPAELPQDLRSFADDLFSPRDRTKALKHLGDAAPRGPKTFVDFAPSAVYSPVPYAPSALLMGMGRAFGASTLMLMYLGRIGSLLGTIGLLSLAVRRIPTRKWMLATVALLPVTVLQASMLSADGVTIGLAVLVLALALDVAATPRGEVTGGRLAEIAIATVALGLSKPPYILFAVAFAIPFRRHGRAVARALAASVGAGFAATAAWGAYASSVYVAPHFPNPGRDPFLVFTHVDPHRQETLVLHRPWTFLQTIQRTLAFSWHDFLRDVVAQAPLVALWPWIVVAGLAILAASTALPVTAPLAVLRWRSRVLLLGIALATFVALMALAYVGWNAVGAPRISAFQGRYLVPIVPLLLVTLPVPTRRARADDGGGVEAVLAASSMLLLVAAWFCLRAKFY
jgi:uncharacterized membrane protein